MNVVECSEEETVSPFAKHQITFLYFKKKCSWFLYFRKETKKLHSKSFLPVGNNACEFGIKDKRICFRRMCGYLRYFYFTLSSNI